MYRFFKRTQKRRGKAPLGFEPEVVKEAVYKIDRLPVVKERSTKNIPRVNGVEIIASDRNKLIAPKPNLMRPRARTNTNLN